MQILRILGYILFLYKLTFLQSDAQSANFENRGEKSENANAAVTEVHDVHATICKTRSIYFSKKSSFVLFLTWSDSQISGSVEQRWIEVGHAVQVVQKRGLEIFC